MVVSDPSIDPITGLPVLNPSGPVQQIPLGQEVFPYADLNATAQPTRGPIYGDDIIPTSSLITAPDFRMKPRSVQATTTRELRVREAVFQNKGAAIPDGTTAPVDVNVVFGGGGGGGAQTFVPKQVELSGRLGIDPQFIDLPDVLTYKYMIGYHVSFLPVDGGGAQNVSPFVIQLVFNTTPRTRIDLMYAYAQYSVSDATFHSFPVNTTSYFPYKMDISAIVAAGADSCELDANGAADGSVWSASMIFSDV